MFVGGSDCSSGGDVNTTSAVNDGDDGSCVTALLSPPATELTTAASALATACCSCFSCCSSCCRSSCCIFSARSRLCSPTFQMTSLSSCTTSPLGPPH